MRKFSDFNVTVKSNPFRGDKVKIDRVLNREITVTAYKIEPSDFKEKGDGLRLVLAFTLSGQQHILFTSSLTLKEMIKRVPPEGFPFTTTILKQNERYEFT